MSADLRDLYQEVILDHGRRPRNFRKPDAASREADGYNPLCGDLVHVYVTVDGGVIRDVAFQGKGCAISTASASVMTEAIRGKTEAEVEALFERFHAVVTGKAPAGDDLGKLAVFSGVSEFPVRVKCATLAWHTVRAALKEEPKPVTTE